MHRAVIDGDAATGVTIMRVVKALDAGPMLATVRRPIGPDDTSDEVERDLARLGADSAASRRSTSSSRAVCARFPKTTPTPPTHRGSRRTTAGSTGRWPAERIHNLIRGLHPWPHAFTFLGGRRFILLRSAAVA